MTLKRVDIEAQESEKLAHYAVKSADSRGRASKEPEDEFRTCFQRDRDRIIHSKAFRRLRGKTQVFIASYGDHYRSRLAHSMEVAQLGRDMARTLSLNEDLAEAIALAHDLGHTPFGHAGQDALHELMKAHGERFEHNEQSRRIVEFLEEKKPDYRGLNLSFEVNDGLLKHRTTYDQPAITDTKMPSLESQIVNMADEIAYQNHDIDDAFRSGVLTLADFEPLRIWQRAKKLVPHHLPEPYLIRAMVSSLIQLMVHDLTQNTHRILTEKKMQSVDQIYQTAESLCDFSGELKPETVELKAFLYKNFYQSDAVAKYNQEGKTVITTLFNAMMNNPDLLPEKIRQNPHSEKEIILIKDYIAGMTDQFALSIYEKLRG